MHSGIPLITSPSQQFLEMSRNTPPRRGFIKVRCVTSQRTAAKYINVTAPKAIWLFFTELFFILYAIFICSYRYYDNNIM